MVRKKKKQVKPVSREDAMKAVKTHNFWVAFQMLCEKVGKMKEYFWFVKNRDADATREQKKSFIKRMTRLLAYNYDVHRCPPPVIYGTLKKPGEAGAQPLRYPPEWNEKEA
jgi:hypothetical protein